MKTNRLTAQDSAWNGILDVLANCNSSTKFKEMKKLTTHIALFTMLVTGSVYAQSTSGTGKMKPKDDAAQGTSGTTVPQGNRVKGTTEESANPTTESTTQSQGTSSQGTAAWPQSSGTTGSTTQPPAESGSGSSSTGAVSGSSGSQGTGALGTGSRDQAQGNNNGNLNGSSRKESKKNQKNKSNTP
jgi:hypothetical protein